MLKLPGMAYVTNKTENKIVMVQQGVSGYFEMKESTKLTVDELNAEIGVSKQQASAMYMGSLHGWRTPGADPNNYDEDGKYVTKNN